MNQKSRTDDAPIPRCKMIGGKRQYSACQKRKGIATVWSHTLNNRISIIILGFFLIILACNNGFLNPGLRVPRVVDLGSCWSGAEVESSITVENKGSTPVEILNIGIDKGETAFEYEPVMLPGETQEIRFTILPEQPCTTYERGCSGERELISNHEREFREIIISTDDPEARRVSVLI